MLLSLDSGTSALEQFQEDMDVIGNNIANVNTIGYKASDMNFADALSQTLGSNSAGVMQLGSGVVTSSIATRFTQGSTSSTGVASDLAISGNGFFLVQDASTTPPVDYVTRAGDFAVDGSGYLVTSNGMRLQGYTDSGLTTQGSIQIDNNPNIPSGNTSGVKNYSFGSDGKLTIVMGDGTTFTGGQVLLQNFASPTQLMNAGNNLYSNLAAAGPLTTAPVAPGTGGVGSIVAGSLEMSNVDLASQLTDLITAQRAYEANAKVITTSDQILQDVDNLGR